MILFPPFFRYSDPCKWHSLECKDLQQIKSSSVGMESFIRDRMAFKRKDRCKSWGKEPAPTVLQRVLRPNISHLLTDCSHPDTLPSYMNLKDLSLSLALFLNSLLTIHFTFNEVYLCRIRFYLEPCGYSSALLVTSQLLV